MHRQMADMMKQMGRGKGMFARMGGMLGMGGGAPGGMAGMDPAALEKLAKGGGLPGGLAGRRSPALPAGLPGGPKASRVSAAAGDSPACQDSPKKK